MVLNRIIAVALVLLVCATGNTAAELIITDGDSLILDGERIRLFGIDAPEGGQRCKDARGLEYDCGASATAALVKIIAGQPVRCDPQDRDRYRRSVSTCYAGNVDIGAEMVRQGHALAFIRYSTRYVGLEAEARAAGRGMWAGTFEPPWDWRRR